MIQMIEGDVRAHPKNSGSSPRRVTLRDVARRAEVNESSVSVVLNGAKSNTGVSPETRERITLAASELGYEPNVHAQRLVKGGFTNTVALMPMLLDGGTQTRQLLLIQNLLSDQGFNVPVYARGTQGSREYVNELINSVCRQEPRAIVTGLPRTDIIEPLSRYLKRGGIVVRYAANSFLDSEEFSDAVIFDTDDAIYQSARHLLELGHRKLGFFNGGKDKWSRAWMLGFGRALAEYDLEVRDDWRFCGGDPYFGLEEGGASLAQQWLALSPQSRPTGLCIINDHAAAAFIAGIERAGLQVPRDVSVVGFDDLPIALYNRLPITTVSKSLEDIASIVIELLNGRLAGSFEDVPQKRIVKGKLQVRASTGPPP